MDDKSRRRIFLCLMHAPVYNKQGLVGTSAITNLDIHDIARLSRSYDLGGFFIVHSQEEQRRLAENIIAHWTQGYGASYNEKRQQALSMVRVVPGFDDVLKNVEELFPGSKPLTVVTKSKVWEDDRSFPEVREVMSKDQPVVLIFGTAWGLTDEFLKAADVRLKPIRPGVYNHLSVRSAVSIIVDRLVGEAGE